MPRDPRRPAEEDAARTAVGSLLQLVARYLVVGVDQLVGEALAARRVALRQLIRALQDNAVDPPSPFGGERPIPCQNDAPAPA
jgi:hypothetical protein